MLKHSRCISKSMASNAARGVVDFGGETFRDVWTRVIYPVIKEECEELVNTVPLRMRVKQDKLFEKKREAIAKTRRTRKSFRAK